MIHMSTNSCFSPPETQQQGVVPQLTQQPTKMLRQPRRGRPRLNQPKPSELLPPVEEETGVVYGAPRQSAHLKAAVDKLLEATQPINTKLAYDKRKEEYKAFVDACHPDDEFRHVINPDYVYDFVFYQVMRGKRKRGGRRSRVNQIFDLDDYNDVMQRYVMYRQNRRLLPPEPTDPVGPSTVAMYKTVIRHMWKEQLSKRLHSWQFSEVWSMELENLHTLIKRRRCAVNKRLYKEKVDHDFAPYHAAEQFGEIEAETWRRGHGCIRSGFAWIRHRFCLLFTTSGILRCESLYKAELSDFLGITVKKETDVHPVYIMILQIATGT